MELVSRRAFEWTGDDAHEACEDGAPVALLVPRPEAGTHAQEWAVYGQTGQGWERLDAGDSVVEAPRAGGVAANASRPVGANGATVPSAPRLVVAGCATGPRLAPHAAETASSPQVGTLFEGWHTFGAQALANISRRGGAKLAVEDVIRSNGQLQLSDILSKWGEESDAMHFYYQATPSMGYYCWYRAPPGGPRVAADCENITATLTQEAQWLTRAGVDFVSIDASNLPTWSPQAEGIQVRPQAVIFEEWAALRGRGGATPAITAFQTVPAGGTLWKDAVALYTAPGSEALVYRAPSAGHGGQERKVFFVPSPPGHGPDAGIVAEIERQANATVVDMWALFSASTAAQGRWAFMSPCTDSRSGDFTTSVAGRGAGTPCGQALTTNAPIGTARTAMAVGPSYQLAYSSLEQSPGKLGGLTLRRQVATALRDRPEFLFLSSWNEWIAQPQANPYGPAAADGKPSGWERVMSPAARAALGASPETTAAGAASPYAFSVGLPGDSMRFSLWVDSYGSSLDRDIEPSVQGGADRNGTRMYDLVASCLRVMRLQRLLAPTGSEPGARSFVPVAGASAPCSVAGEVCCQATDAELWRPVWSLRAKTGDDSLLTVDPNELAILTAPGGPYEQVCSAYSGPTDWCVDQGVLASHAAVEGPFVVGGPPNLDGGAPAQGLGAGSVPLYRCLTPRQQHLFSTHSDCEGIGRAESMLGGISPTRSSATPRQLVRCAAAGGKGYYHSLDAGCREGDVGTAVLGFVH
ncbi:hypothetical protein FNF31_03462 [Cafeteria roenbergensis]|uniref:Uncharacterized protein n=1 Tax=Cafeteria roenbergensis TaxID=33653 RepID=A0A5A8DDT5_CAFRO|nr:hypothetical protein FNF31_03462 [Cafeteria roenbergensis]